MECKDAASCYVSGVVWLGCLLGTTASVAKTDEPIDTSVGLWTRLRVQGTTY